MNELGIKLDKINVVRKYANEEFTIFAEVHISKNINKYGTIYCVLYSQNDEILDSNEEFIDLAVFNGLKIMEWSFDVRPPQVEKIKIFPQFENHIY